MLLNTPQLFFVPAHFVPAPFVPAHHSTSPVGLFGNNTVHHLCNYRCGKLYWFVFRGNQTPGLKPGGEPTLVPFWRQPGIIIMVGFFVCPISLILFLALAGGLGSVHGLGEDLDRPLFGPPGSPIWLKESDPGLQKALMFAEERYNRGSNAMHLRKVSRLVSATRQVRLLYNAFIYIYPYMWWKRFIFLTFLWSNTIVE